MAKRMKLGEHGEKMDILTKAQELTATHETAKMVKLAEDLKRIATDSMLTPYNRHRLYKDCLWEFRAAQEKVIREGTSLLDGTNLKDHWDYLRSMLREELQRHLVEEKEPQQEQSSAYTTPMTTPQSSTPLSTSSLTPTTPTPSEDPKSAAIKILKEKGAQWQSGGRVTFPAPTKFPETSYTPSHNGYTSNNVQKAIDYLFSPNHLTMPTRNGMDTIIFNIYFGLRKSRSLPGWIAQYPNLKDIHNQYATMKSSQWN